MSVVKAAEGDLNGWLELAADVEHLFGPMVSDPRFIQVIEKNIFRMVLKVVLDKNSNCY